jgi:hypothetical protein
MEHKKLTDKIKEGVSTQQLENFARKHTPEVFSTLDIFIGAVSSIFDFFTGAGWSILFLAIGAIVAIAFPVFVEKKLKKICHFTLTQEKTTEMVLGGVKIVIAIFLPFLYFGFLGLLAGTSYHYYIRHTQIMEENDPHHAQQSPHKGRDHN